MYREELRDGRRVEVGLPPGLLTVVYFDVVDIDTRRPPSEDELRAAVFRQFGFINRSANAVLEGSLDEAVRVALAIRVLVHDTRSSHSVLGQLGWKNRMQYVNSLREIDLIVGIGPEGQRVGAPRMGLVNAVFGGPVGAAYYPLLERGGLVESRLPFRRWWRDKMLHNDAGPPVSRWDVIDGMVHADGGAHVDPRGLPPAYAHFKLQGGGMFIGPALTDGPPETLEGIEIEPVGGSAEATVVQIAWELEKTVACSRLMEIVAPMA